MKKQKHNSKPYKIQPALIKAVKEYDKIYGDSQPVQGQKHDSDKVPIDLIPAEVIQALSEVLGYGAKKYAPNNWQKGINHSRIYSALMRHLLADKRGEVKDPESGLPHRWHVLCNAAFLVWYQKHRPDLDDLTEKP